MATVVVLILVAIGALVTQAAIRHFEERASKILESRLNAISSAETNADANSSEFQQMINLA